MSIHVNPLFPKNIIVGDWIKLIGPYEKVITIVVDGIWYPEEGEKWNETKEMVNMGYLNSSPRRPFPQIISSTMVNDEGEIVSNPEGRLKIDGDDYDAILAIFTTIKE